MRVLENGLRFGAHCYGRFERVILLSLAVEEDKAEALSFHNGVSP